MKKEKKPEVKKYFCEGCGAELRMEDAPAEKYGKCVGFGLHYDYVPYPAYNSSTGEKNLMIKYTCPKRVSMKKNIFGCYRETVDTTHDSFAIKKNF